MWYDREDGGIYGWFLTCTLIQKEGTNIIYKFLKQESGQTYKLK
jgi:hypothetical protein